VYLLAKLSLENPLILPQVGHVIYVLVNLTEKHIALMKLIPSMIFQAKKRLILI